MTPPVYPPGGGAFGVTPMSPGALSPGGVPGRGGLQTVLDERPLRVTMLLHVVKLLPRETRR